MGSSPWPSGIQPRMPSDVRTWHFRCTVGYGYIDEYKVQRLYRDAKILEIYEGSKEMEKTIIAGDVGAVIAKKNQISGIDLWIWVVVTPNCGFNALGYRKFAVIGRKPRQKIVGAAPL